LFSLLRRRVQVVDLWFNPARYGADRGFAAIGARIKDAVD
jgi:hypothetical protein